MALPETPTCKLNDLQVLEDVTDVSDNDINREELVDLQENHCDQDKLVGWEIEAIHENEWFIGELTYFNKKLAKYMVSFTDGSEDYIDLDILLL